MYKFQLLRWIDYHKTAVLCCKLVLCFRENEILAPNSIVITLELGQQSFDCFSFSADIQGASRRRISHL